jgi:hypothetical protein
MGQQPIDFSFLSSSGPSPILLLPLTFQRFLLIPVSLFCFLSSASFFPARVILYSLTLSFFFFSAGGGSSAARNPAKEEMAADWVQEERDAVVAAEMGDAAWSVRWQRRWC